MPSYRGKRRGGEWGEFLNEHHRLGRSPQRGHTLIPVHAEGVQKMTQLERRYADRLELLKAAGELLEWRFEPLKFRLAKRTWYTPDFLLVYSSRFEIHETKGWWEDDARVKWKTCAELYPWFHFVAVTEKKGEWVYEHYGDSPDGTRK